MKEYIYEDDILTNTNYNPIQSRYFLIQVELLYNAAKKHVGVETSSLV